MALSEELRWRGFVNQTTFDDVTALDGAPLTFYWGVDPSADSMTVGHLAMAMMVKHFIAAGHKAVLLVGGATGLVGDPDGKAEERTLQSIQEVAHNKAQVVGQYERLFEGQPFQLVDNYDWFKDMKFLEFLRIVGKHVPMRQMLAREFVQSRLGEDGSGISYAEFSYALIQGYDFLHLSREYGVSLQVCGSDQWGNSIAGVDLIRRIDGREAHVWSAPLVINKATGKKFGKTEAGAIWLDPAKTSPTQFYQFWMNADDVSSEEFLKLYTMLDEPTITELIEAHRQAPQERRAQQRLAQEVTKLIHGEAEMKFAETVTSYLTGRMPLHDADAAALAEMRKEIPAAQAAPGDDMSAALVESGLCNSTSEARRLIKENGISINGQKVAHARFEVADFQNGRLLLRRGKAFKDSALIELKG